MGAPPREKREAARRVLLPNMIDDVSTHVKTWRLYVTTERPYASFEYVRDHYEPILVNIYSRSGDFVVMPRDKVTALTETPCNGFRWVWNG